MVHVYGEPLPEGVDAFTARRRTGIGGSDAAAILGVSPWGSALSVWQDKRGLSEAREPIERMVWGTRLESAVRQGYAEDTLQRVERVGFRRLNADSFVIGHPDGKVTRKEGQPVEGKGLEIKVVSRTGDQWGEPGSADVPAHYFAQCQHYMLLMDWEVMDLAALVGGREMRVFTLPRSDVFIGAMLEEEEAFWQRVVNDDPPEPDGSDSAAKALRRLYPVAVDDSIVATPAVAEYAQTYLDAKVRVEVAEHDKEQAAQRLKSFMGERRRLVGEGFTATWPNAKGKVSWKGVAAAFRKVIEDLVTPEGEVRVHEYVPLDLDTLEGLHRGEAGRGNLTVTPKENR